LPLVNTIAKELFLGRKILEGPLPSHRPFAPQSYAYGSGWHPF